MPALPYYIRVFSGLASIVWRRPSRRDLPSATGADPALVPGVGDVQERPVDAVGPHKTGQAGYSWVELRTGMVAVVVGAAALAVVGVAVAVSPWWWMAAVPLAVLGVIGV